MKKKILTALAILTLLFTFLAITAFATSEEFNTDTTLTADASDAADEEVGSPDADSGSENIFAVIYSAILENSDKLLSALAFLGSLVIAFAYKKGLIPIIKGSLSALTSAVVTLKEETASGMESTSKEALAVREKFESAEQLLSSLTERLDSLSTELSCLSEEKKRSEALRLIMSSQVDMLYEIFMSSALPQYQKDSVGERIGEMKRALAEGVKND